MIVENKYRFGDSKWWISIKYKSYISDLKKSDIQIFEEALEDSLAVLNIYGRSLPKDEMIKIKKIFDIKVLTNKFDPFHSNLSNSLLSFGALFVAISAFLFSHSKVYKARIICSPISHALDKYQCSLVHHAQNFEIFSLYTTLLMVAFLLIAGNFILSMLPAVKEFISKDRKNLRKLAVNEAMNKCIQSKP